MDFEVFSKDDIQQVYRAVVHNMSPAQREAVCGRFGGMEQFEAYFLDALSSRQAQEQLAKTVEWYGGKDSAMAVMLEPMDSKIAAAYGKRMNAVMEKLAAKRGTDVRLFEVKEIVGELDFVAKQLFRMKDVSALLLDVARQYQEDVKMKQMVEQRMGQGSADYIAQAIQAFYGKASIRNAENQGVVRDPGT